jgi:hypothetical protein
MSLEKCYMHTYGSGLSCITSKNEQIRGITSEEITRFVSRRVDHGRMSQVVFRTEIVIITNSAFIPNAPTTTTFANDLSGL